MTDTPEPRRRRSGVTMVPLKCSNCGSDFERELRQMYKNNKYYYCSPRCVAQGRKERMKKIRRPAK